MVCAFTGYRPEKFSFGYDETHPDCVRLKEVLAREISRLAEDGYGTFLSGMAMGVDLWAAEAVLSQRERRPDLRLEAVIPHPGQERAWSDGWQQRYRRVRGLADREVVVSPRYLPGCMGARNRYLVDHSDLLFAVFSGIRGGTSGTIDYAASRGRDILLLRPDNFRVLRLTKET